MSWRVNGEEPKKLFEDVGPLLKLLLMFVLVIVGATFLLRAPSPAKPSLWTYRMPGASDRKVEGCLNNLGRLVLAVKLFTYEEKRRPGSLEELLVGEKPLLQQIPLCPAARRNTYSEGYSLFELEFEVKESLHPTQGFMITCSGANHRGGGLLPDYPRFDLRTGFMVGTNR